MGMKTLSDEELIKWLREWHFPDCHAAAYRIEQLVATNEQLEKELHTSRMASVIMDNTVAEAESKLAKAVEALRLVTDACDEGQMASLGTGGMTIDAQIRRSVYNQVPAWPIEEARAALAELEKTE